MQTQDISPHVVCFCSAPSVGGVENWHLLFMLKQRGKGHRQPSLGLHTLL